VYDAIASGQDPRRIADDWRGAAGEVPKASREVPYLQVAGIAAIASSFRQNVLT
jgi:hypothetical protein